MGKNVTPDNLALRERLLEMLTECWPAKRTTAQLVDTCGMQRSTWSWCSGGDHCYMIKDVLGRLPNHIHGPVTHYAPHQGPHTGTDAAGNEHGCDTYLIDVSYQVVYPQLNAMQKLGKVEKHDASGGLVCWSAIDDGLVAEREEEALTILRRTLEEAGRREAEARQRALEEIQQAERVVVGVDLGQDREDATMVLMDVQTGQVALWPADDPREVLASRVQGR